MRALFERESFIYGLNSKKHDPMRRYLVSDLEKCTGCRLCELACSEVKKKVYNPKKALIRVVRAPPGLSVAIACRLCENPPCVACCPEDALEADENGRIKVDGDKCNGCSWCFSVCDFGAIVLDPGEKIVKICDLCDGDPECVKACPEEALELTTDEIVASRARRFVAEKFVKEVFAKAKE